MFASITAGFRKLLRGSDVRREVDDELAHFLEQATDERLRAGMDPAEAARQARAEIGSITGAREEAMSGGWEVRLDSLWRDIRHGLRAVGRTPGFAATAILTIALGIGATTTMFSVVNAIILRPLPWKDAGSLSLIWTDDVRRGLHREATAYRTIGEWKSATRAFQDIAYYTTQRVAPMANGGSERGRSRSALISANLFAVLGVPPALGRTLTAADETDRATVAVISHGFWQRWFASAPDVVGKSLIVDDASKGGIGTLTVIGVMPAGFYFPDRQTEIWTPATTYWRFNRESTEWFPSWARRWTAIGRLAPGTSIQTARGELRLIGRQLETAHANPPADFPGFSTSIVPVLDVVTGETLQQTLWMLLGAVSLVLLIACVNVANLLLARGAARQHELAVRRALGAGRWQIARQLVVESLLLAGAGGTLGTLIAMWGGGVLGTAASGFVPRIGEIAMDWRVIGFSIAASLASGLIFGLAPALRLSKARATDALKDGGRGASRAGVSRSRGVLVMTECALALILLTGAGLLLRSLAHLDAVDPGFDTSNVLAVRLEFPPEPPPTAAERTQTSPIAQARARARVGLAGQLVERLRGLQGVTQVGFIDDLMVNGRGNRSVTIPGRSAEASGSGELNEALMSAGFFPVMQVPLRRGRLIADEDVEQKIRALWSPVRTDLSLAEKERLAVPEPVVVNEAFAKRFFPGEDAVGRKFCIDPTNKTYWYEIVGVVGDMHRQGLDRRPIPEYYGPWILSPNGRADLLLRTSGDPLALASSVREVARSVIPGVTVVSASTADALLGDFSAQRRLQTWLLSVFALLALTLAAIGIFGLVHFAVAERTREIGVRVALGATPGQVMSLVLGEGMRTPVVGIVVGLAASLALTRVLSSLLFGVGATDPVTFAAMAAVLAAVASIACWLAGRRALGVDPVRALRD